MKTTTKKRTNLCLLLLCFLGWQLEVHSQATVTMPVAVGANSCTGSTNSFNYYNYNGSTNALTDLANCVPMLRIGTSGSLATPNSYTRSLASLSFNPKDKNFYYFWTNGSGSSLRTYVWRWPASGTTCAGSTTTFLGRIDTLRSFAYDILGVAFDKNGNGYIVEFGSSIPNTGYIRSIDFTTGVIGPQKQMALTGGAVIYQNSVAGDVAMSPNGQMYFAADNKLFTPDYASYSSASPTITTTYIDTIKGVPTGYGLIGLTYAQGELVAAYSKGSGSSRVCLYQQLDPLTVTNITASSPTRSVWDFASIVSGVGAAKNLVSITPTGVPKQYTVVYDVYVKNYGTTDLTNVQVTDDLTAINGSGNISSVSTSFVSNPAGLVLNSSFNGNSNKNLLSGTVGLPNYPTTSNFAVIRITCVLSNINTGTVYNNSATVTATGFNGASLSDVSTNGTSPDLNINDKPDDAGENQPTPLLISVVAQTPPCASLTSVLYSQDFGTGGNTATLPSLPTSSTAYTGTTTQPIGVDRFMITANANNADNTKFLNLTDRSGSGRMMVVNADVNTNVIYRGDVTAALCANQQYSLVFYAAFVGNSNYQTICNAFGGFTYPRIKMRIRDAGTGLIISEVSTTDITAATWTRYGMKYVLPSGFSNVYFELVNDAPGGCGNDVALDDIQFGLCSPLPVVSITNTSAGCIGSSTSFDASLSDPGAVSSPVYQWQVSSDNITFTNILGATSATYSIPVVAAGDINKYYRVLVAASGNMGVASCQYTSPGFLLTAKTPSVAPTNISKNKPSSCPGETIQLRVNGGALGNGAVYRWYSGSCGGTLIGTGSTITVSPTTSTTYYVRIEGDCNNTACISTTITFSCDIDADDDGIPDITESNGVDPKFDDDFDGLPNWKDPDYAGFIDTNGDGVNDNFDWDKDGVPDFLDRDSDNDGIPDVVESGGADSNGDGKIDGYADIDNDGLSDNVDANLSGYLSSGDGLGLADRDGDGIPNIRDADSDGDGIPDVREVYGADSNNDGMLDYTGTFASNDTDGDGLMNNVDGDADNNGTIENTNGPLLKTGAVLANGRAGSYPNKNMDADGVANPYDLDSDGDGITDVREAGFSDANFDGLCDGAANVKGWNTTIASMGSLSLPNRDGVGRENLYDIDSDGDGIPDNIEALATNSYLLPVYTDSDGDGIDDSYDTINGYGGRGIIPIDTDNDLSPDYLDLDTDGDNMSDIIEGNDLNFNNLIDDNVSPTGIDTDGDGLDDRFDADNSSAKSTSRYMGNGGSMSGPVSPGSITTLQKYLASNPERDWRYSYYVLEVRFLNMNVVSDKNANQIHWEVIATEQISQYSVERSNDGVHFIEVANIKGMPGSQTAQSFLATDSVAIPAGTKQVHYRIKVLKPGGQYYSKIVSVKMASKQASQSINVLVNPVLNELLLGLTARKKTLVDLQITDATGRLIDRFSWQLKEGYNKVTWAPKLPLSKGLYYVLGIIDGERHSSIFISK
ncbi:MAG: hypothetical protein EOO10_04645 [Chitinophagaceae bacterium]|nr:MAG: hypothetical protein EOO10_04645 [Chitinophagaceae bacterium]